ncbi:MAG TPA: hypothetical protein VJ482_12330 [Acidimicrobiia bacterium]|nr:hypothetical protein [Acidimicrobiia bacterium]
MFLADAIRHGGSEVGIEFGAIGERPTQLMGGDLTYFRNDGFA